MKWFGLASLLLVVGLAWPASADYSVRAKIGNLYVRAGDAGPRLGRHNGKRHRAKGHGAKRRGVRRQGRKPWRRERHGRRGRHLKGGHGSYFYGYPRYDWDYVNDEDYDPELPPPEPVAPAPPVQPQAEPEPLDPGGSLRLVVARGPEAMGQPWRVGEALPSWLPHVLLDPRRYDLPQPPAGQVYARVRRDVLLIRPVSRVVVAEVAH